MVQDARVGCRVESGRGKTDVTRQDNVLIWDAEYSKLYLRRSHFDGHCLAVVTFRRVENLRLQR